MYLDKTIAVVIPALNEELSIGTVVNDLMALRDDTGAGALIDDIVVCDNGSTDSCLLYTSPSPRDKRQSRMPSSA